MLNSRVSRLLLSLLSATLLCAPSHATAEPALRPFVRDVLPNGVVLLVTANPTADVVGMEIISRVGSRLETSDQAGLASLTLRVLMEGAGSPARDWVEARGGTLDYRVHPDYQEIGAALRSEEFPGLARTLAHIFATFTLDRFEDQRTTAVTAASNPDNDQAAAYQSLRTLLGDGSAYGRAESGVPATLARLQADDVSRFYRAAFGGREIVVSVSGRIDTGKALPLLRELFGALPAGDPPPALPPITRPVHEPKSMVLAGSGDEAWLMIGFPMPGVRRSDYPAVSVLNAIIGGSDSGEIPSDFRQKNGVYDSGSFLQPFAERSHIVGYLRADPLLWDQQQQKLQPVVDDLLQQLAAIFARLHDHGATPEEVQRAKEFIIGQVLRMHDHNKDAAGFLGWYEAIGLGSSYDQHFLQEVRGVTLEQINKLASSRLAPDQAVTVLLLPRPRAEDTQ